MTLNDWSQGKQLILFPENLNKSQTLRQEGNKTNGFLGNLSFSDFLTHLAIKKCEKLFLKTFKKFYKS